VKADGVWLWQARDKLVLELEVTKINYQQQQCANTELQDELARLANKVSRRLLTTVRCLDICRDDTFPFLERQIRFGCLQCFMTIYYLPHCYYDSVKFPCIVCVTASLKSVHC